MLDLAIRIWRSTSVEEEYRCNNWHVSYSDRTPMQALRSLMNAEGPINFGMTWDEALGTVCRLMLCGGAVYLSLAAYLEPPTGLGWELLLEIDPVFPYWRVVSRSSVWDHLDVGEAMATFVRETFPVDWKGFKEDRRGSSFALTVVAS